MSGARAGRQLVFLILVLTSCRPGTDAIDAADNTDAGDQSGADVFAPIGQPVPSATPEQLATFARGKAVALRRFDLKDGLGPTFNVTFCAACHERPATGGSAGRYRNFFISGTRDQNGRFTLGATGGVIRVFHYGPGDLARPVIPADRNVFAQRNAIPFIGVGLLAELSDAEILSRSDPDDANGDGISGRPNFENQRLGRFGRKCQTASIEGFIRGPLFNHLGITTNPLSDELRGRLPIDSSALGFLRRGKDIRPLTQQAAAGEAPTLDNDGVPDPELSEADLFDLVSFSMLLAPPAPDPPTEQTLRGRALFEQAGCTGCHAPALKGPRGDLPAFTDLLIHDMGPGLADGIEQGVAGGSEFRTQPLWGIAAVGPYLHDGRADTLEDAILAHGGEAAVSRDAFAAMSLEQRADLVEFLLSLGGRNQYSTGLLPPGAPVPAVGEYGGPRRALNQAEPTLFIQGREVFDRDFSQSAGLGGEVGADGGARFNGDSCRACHQDPVIGGAGPRDVNVMRHGTLSSGGLFSPPAGAHGTILHKEIALGFLPVRPASDINVFEHRQTPHLFGLGLIDAIPESAILANEDPADLDGDGISGRAHRLPDGRIGRFGWKANVPSLHEFVRDAFANELGLSVPAETGFTFGFLQDVDHAADPEVHSDDLSHLDFFLALLAPPPRQPNAADASAQEGRQIFADIGCTKCHLPSLPAIVDGATIDVPLFSDLLLHEILVPGAPGIEDGQAGMREFRTAPLWGLSRTAPYFHTGEADTIDQAIRLHAGEAAGAIDRYLQLTEESQRALLAFLMSL